jgi:8-oxo-dGTP pyrophosphatase MutT (NUDIX family)
MTRIQPIRPAATVILVRDAGTSAEQGFELFMLCRTAQAAFAGGMFVFPGGRVDGDDHLHAYDPWRVGPAPAQHAQQRALGSEWRGYWIAAIRESFEEAGLLLAYDESGALLDFGDPVRHERFEAYRDPLHAGEVSLLDICQREGLRLAADRLHFYNRFITPLGRPRRFDTRFFVAEAPPGQTGAHDTHETVDSVWISPAEALAKNDAGEFELMCVTRVQLQELAGYADRHELLAAARARSAFPVFRPSVPVA